MKLIAAIIQQEDANEATAEPPERLAVTTKLEVLAVS